MWGTQKLLTFAFATALCLGTTAVWASARADDRGSAGQGEGALVAYQVAQVAGTVTTQVPFFACFEASLALRIGTEVVDGSVRHWVKERFESGSCLALPAGTRINRLTNTTVDGRHAQIFQIDGSTIWLTRPDWAMTMAARGNNTPEQAAFSKLVPVTEELMTFAALHMECLKDVADLNARVEEHNKRFVEREETQGQEEAISKTVIVFNASTLDKKGARLNREVAKFRARCDKYRSFEAATQFFELVRELAGLPARSSVPSAA